MYGIFFHMRPPPMKLQSVVCVFDRHRHTRGLSSLAVVATPKRSGTDEVRFTSGISQLGTCMPSHDIASRLQQGLRRRGGPHQCVDRCKR